MKTKACWHRNEIEILMKTSKTSCTKEPIILWTHSYSRSYLGYRPLWFHAQHVSVLYFLELYHHASFVRKWSFLPSIILPNNKALTTGFIDYLGKRRRIHFQILLFPDTWVVNMLFRSFKFTHGVTQRACVDKSLCSLYQYQVKKM